MATLSNNEKKFLRMLEKTVKKPLNLAWMLTIISTLLFVLQSWLLAQLFSTWLTNYFNELPLSYDVPIGWFYGLLVCFIVRPLLNSGRELLGTHASLEVRRQLRESLLSAMAKLGPNLRRFGSDGSISSQIIDQTDALDGFISRFSVQKKVTVTTPIILLIAVAWQSKFAAALLFLTAPLVPIFMILIGHLTARKSAEQFSALSQLSGRFLDWIRGMPTLKRLQATAIAEHNLAQSSEDYRRRTMDVLKIAFLNGAVLELLSALSIALVAVYLGFGLMGILPWDKGHIPVPYFGALFILLLAPEFYVPLRQLGADYHAKAEAEGAVQSLLPILQAAGSIPDDEAQSNPNLKVTILSQTKPKAAEKSSITSAFNTAATDSSLSTNAESNNSQQSDTFGLSKAFGLHISNVAIHTALEPHDHNLSLPERLTEDTVSDVLPSDNRTTYAVNAGEINTSVSLNSEKPDSVSTPRFRTRLAPVSLTVQPGQRIALIGESGSGKSSLLQAIMGFVDYEGNITLIPETVSSSLNNSELKPTDDQNSYPNPSEINIKDIPVHIFRQHIGYLAQKVALMPMSIAENLRLANPKACDQDLINALEKVELWKLIQKLPNGINTVLGEQGKGLSGGQQQRLGIAQLLLRNDNLWLLDEPTEHLDPDTAERIHTLLEEVSREKTVIWITHSHQQLPWLETVISLSSSRNLEYPIHDSIATDSVTIIDNDLSLKQPSSESIKSIKSPETISTNTVNTNTVYINSANKTTANKNSTKKDTRQNYNVVRDTSKTGAVERNPSNKPAVDKGDVNE